MKALRLVILIVAFCTIPSGLARAQSAEVDVASVRKVLAEYRAAIDPLDTARLRAIHAVDVVVVDGGVVSRGRETFLKLLQADLGGSSKGWKFTSMEVVEVRFASATTAIALATWEGGVPGRMAQKGIWLVTLVKHGSDWLMEAWSSAPAGK